MKLIRLVLNADVDGDDVPVCFGYSPDYSPFEVVVVVGVGAPYPVQFIMPRDVFLDPSNKESAMKALSTRVDDDKVIWTMHTSSRDLDITFAKDAMDEWTEAMLELAPAGEEGSYINWDEELRVLLSE